MNKLILTMIGVLFCLSCYALTMNVSATKIVLDEAFRMTLTSEDARAEPDLTPLQKDFIIAGTERSINYTVINGKATSQSQWIILVKTRHKGILTIPSFAFGAERTPENHIEVVEGNINVNIGARSKGVRLTAELSQLTPFVNEQVIYTLKLYYQRQLVNAQLMPPQIRHGMIMPLGDAEQYETEENGLRTIVESQKFVIFPQKSGKIAITPARFSGMALGGMLQKVEAAGPRFVLDVKSAPLNQSSRHWLPAQKIWFEERLSGVPDRVKIGEPVTRTVTVKAEGVPAELLPVLHITQHPGFGIYADKAHRRNEIKNETLVGSITTKLTYLFDQPGEALIPPITLNWFNTKTGQFEKAELPERKIMIIGDALQTNSMLGANHVDLSKSEILQPKTRKEKPESSKQSLLPWYLVLLFGSAWVITGLLWLRKSRQDKAHASSKKIRQALKKACEMHHAVAAKDCLLAFAKIKWPHSNILSLNDVQLLAPEKLKAEIKKLSQALYRQTAEPWQGAGFWKAFRQMKK